MEYENKYASKGLGGTALGLSIGALAGGVLSGNFGNILGGGNGNGNCTCNEDHTVNRYELGLQQEIAAKDTRISLLESNIYVDSKIADVYERLNGRINVVEGQLADQRVFNATNTAVLNCVNSQVAALMALTKTVIPNTSICPGWGDVTVAPATTPTTGA